MSDYIVKDTELTSVANAIRTKGGTNSQLVFPGEFVSAIGNISGGGGSSDFSTAEVTLVNSGDTNMAVLIPVFYEADPPFDPDAYVTGAVSMLANETSILNVPLYKGHCSILKGISGDRMSGDTVATSFTVTSRSATLSIGGVDITGDCTITIS